MSIFTSGKVRSFSAAKIASGFFVLAFIFAQTFGAYVKPMIVRAEDAIGDTIADISEANEVEVVEVDTAEEVQTIDVEEVHEVTLGESEEHISSESAVQSIKGDEKGVGHLQIKKIVINDDGGTKIATDFTINIVGTNPSPASFNPPVEGVTIVTIEPGAYDIQEVADQGYVTSYSKDCKGTINADETWNCWVTNNDIPTTPQEYGPYCGDGQVNQAWEMCDGTAGCNTRCQDENQCTEKAFARVVVDSATLKNVGAGNATTDIYLGSSTNVIPSGTWFEIHDGTNFIDDASMMDAPEYDNVPGLAVERDGTGKLRTLLYGYFPENGNNKEHVEGYVEFSNTSAISQVNDIGQNKMEEPTDTLKTMNPNNDEYWMDGGKSHFWMTVDPFSDAFWTSYAAPEDCPITGDLCPADTNLFKNPSFEAPVVTANGGQWEIVPTTNSALKWIAEYLSGGADDSLEIQNIALGWNAKEGSQYAELDGNESTMIYQEIATVPGNEYELGYSFSARPTVAANDLSVYVDGTEINTHSADGTTLSNTDWQDFTNTFVATGATTKIAFSNTDVSDTYGVFLDDMKLVCNGPVDDDGGSGQGGGGNGNGGSNGSSSGGSRSNNSGDGVVLGDSTGPEVPGVVLAATLENTGMNFSGYSLLALALVGFLVATRRKNLTV